MISGAWFKSTATINYILAFIGVTDIAKAYHPVAIALINSENAVQLGRLTESTFKAANVLRGAKGESNVVLEFAASDNSDAIQKAVEDNGGTPVNDKVHFSRNVARAGDLNYSDGVNRIEVVTFIQNALANADKLTHLWGLSNHVR